MKQLPLDFTVPDAPSFTNFWVGDNGEALHAAQSLVTQGNGPLFLWGPAACGKSHLLKAAARAANDEFGCAYLSLNDTEAPVWQALGELPVLTTVCVDGVDPSLLNEDAQRALFVLFDTLGPRPRLILAARTNPAGLKIERTDLYTRLASGLVVRMNPLSDDAKIAALIYRADVRGLRLSHDSARYLLTHGPRDLTTLFQLLGRLDRAALADGRRLTVPFLRTVLALS